MGILFLKLTVSFKKIKIMKNHTWILVFLWTLASCGSIEERKQKKAEEERIQNERVARAEFERDSLATLDSIHNVFVLEQQNIAFGDIQFGMKEGQVNKLKDYKYSIGEFEYMFYPLYFKDSLYFVELRTIPVTANYIDNKLTLQWDNLRKTIVEKYGESIESNPFPEFFSFEPGYVKFTDRWQVGSKVIKIFVGEESSGSKYYTGAWIYDEPSYNEKEALDNSEKETKVVKDANLF